MHLQAFPRAQIFLSEAINEISIVRNSATLLARKPAKILSCLFCKICSAGSRQQTKGQRQGPEFFCKIIIKQAKSKQKAPDLTLFRQIIDMCLVLFLRFCLQTATS